MDYWNVLSSAKVLVERAIQDDAELATASVKIRETPVFLSGTDKLPVVLICPRDNHEEISELDFTRKAQIVYPVIVCILRERSYDQKQLKFRVRVRDAIRLHLWHPPRWTAMHAEIFDVDYNPNPGGVDTSGVVDPVTVSLQEFRVTAHDLRFE